MPLTVGTFHFHIYMDSVLLLLEFDFQPAADLPHCVHSEQVADAVLRGQQYEEVHLDLHPVRVADLFVVYTYPEFGVEQGWGVGQWR